MQALFDAEMPQVDSTALTHELLTQSGEDAVGDITPGVRRVLSLSHTTPAISAALCKEIIYEATIAGFERSLHLAANKVYQVSVNSGQTRFGAQQRLMAIACGIVYGVVAPVVRQVYGVKVNEEWKRHPFRNAALKTSCHDMFVSRYDAHTHAGLDQDEAMSGLSSHRDGNSDFSFVMQLNKPHDFEGGGTRFFNFQSGRGRAVLHIGQGELSTHAACVSHGSEPITPTVSPKNIEAQRLKETSECGFGRSDYRYILAGFLRVEQIDDDMPFVSLHAPEIRRQYERIMASPHLSDSQVDLQLARLFTGEEVAAAVEEDEAVAVEEQS